MEVDEGNTLSRYCGNSRSLLKIIIAYVALRKRRLGYLVLKTPAAPLTNSTIKKVSVHRPLPKFIEFLNGDSSVLGRV